MTAVAPCSLPTVCVVTWICHMFSVEGNWIKTIYLLVHLVILLPLKHYFSMAHPVVNPLSWLFVTSSPSSLSLSLLKWLLASTKRLYTKLFQFSGSPTARVNEIYCPEFFTKLAFKTNKKLLDIDAFLKMWNNAIQIWHVCCSNITIVDWPVPHFW